MPVYNSEISIKNINALFLSVKELTEKSFEQQKKINALNDTIYSLTQKITELETLVVVQKAKLLGHGATVRA